MNCLETRKNFPAFWRNTLDSSARLTFLGHLAGCSACDHSFRLFALTAPVLHSDYVPRSRSPLQTPVATSVPSPSFSRRYAMNRWWAAGLVTAMGAAAALALYLAQPPRVTLEDAFQDAVIEGNPNIQRASFSASDNLFGFQDPDSSAPGFNQQQPLTQGSQDDFGG